LSTALDTALSRPAGFRGEFRDDIDARAAYAEAAGIGQIIPRAVAAPVDADDVVTLVHWTREQGLSLVPRGSGSSMGGGAIGPGVIVDLSSMNSIEQVDVALKRVRVGPGALRDSVNASAAKHGLRFPVDPSSGGFCTIGGMVATNASGPHSLHYGSTRGWVTALDCVFSDGDREVITRGETASKRVGAIARFLRDAHGERARSRSGEARAARAAGTLATCEHGEVVR